jgi:two-component system LytT family response regulator
MKLRSVIADDEPLARNKLASLLRDESDVEVIAQCGNVPETIETVEREKPHILFLDIEMPGGDGFAVLENLDETVQPEVIFTTAFNHYAVQAFEAYALDYLLKPFDQERLRKALDRARAEIRRGNKEELASRLQRLLQQARAQSPVSDRFMIRSGGRVLFLKDDEIDWIEAAANYVKIHHGKDMHLLRETMNSVEKRLDPKKFVRIHRSLIANFTKLKELRPCNSGEFIVTLQNGKELSGSRNYRAAVLPYLKKTDASILPKNG